MPKHQTIAPVYRYFTVDLLTNEILAEIPLRGVSFECALKGAGKFGGKIPITAETDSMSLYDSTMPGNTALYVVRNGVCVWGGIIWARQYQFSSKDLSISASEFTSYFYHRKIWKTFNHQTGATVTYVDNANWVVARTNRATRPGPGTWGTNNQALYAISYDNTFARRADTASVRYDRSASSPSETVMSGLGFGAGGWTSEVRTPVSPGEVLTFSAWVAANYANWRYQVITYFFDAAGTQVGSTVLTPTGNPGASPMTWARVSGTAIAPAGATNVGYVIQLYTASGNSVGTEKVWVADVLIEEGTEVGDFFTGDYPPVPNHRFKWTGTPGASTSIAEFDTTRGLGRWRVLFDNGSHILVKGGSTVHLDFFEPENFKYSGHYRVSDSPAPTLDGFSLLGGSAVADLVSYEAVGNTVTFYTKENHGFNTGDVIDWTVTSDPNNTAPLPGDENASVIAPRGPNSNMFQVVRPFTLNRGMSVIEGYASRPLPSGTYNDVTVTARQDTYDYIRSLIDAMFDDFVGVDFPNVYIEPGISTEIDVVAKSASDGYAFIATAEPHGIAPGQAIQVRDVGPTHDGEYNVTDTPADNILVYEKGGLSSSTGVSTLNAVITTIQMDSGLALLTTQAAHGFKPGQKVNIDLGDEYTEFSGVWVVLDTPSATTFRYRTGSGSSTSQTLLANSTVSVIGDPLNRATRASVTGNVVTLELANPVVFSAGDSVTVAETYRHLPIAEKSLDAPNSVATIKTTVNHGLRVGDTVVIDGLSDQIDIVSKTNTTTAVQMTTARPHNFRVGDNVRIDGQDVHKITSKGLTDNVAIVGFSASHNIPVGGTVTVEDVVDSVAITSRQIVNGVARINTATPHNFGPNTSVQITGLTDSYNVVSKQAVEGLVTLTTSAPHNVLQGQKIVVSGVGVPFDGTEISVEEVTATRVMYKVDSRYWDEKKADAARRGQTLNVPLTVPPSKSSGTVLAVESHYNGSFLVTNSASTWVEYFLTGEDQPLVAATGTSPTLSGPSIMNGTYTVTTRSDIAVTFNRTGANVPFVNVPLAAKDDHMQARVTATTVHAGNRVITAVTPNTFTFAQTLFNAAEQAVELTARKASIFGGSRVITGVPTPDRFTFYLPGYFGSILEAGSDKPAFVRATSLYNGTFQITNVDSVKNTITYSKALAEYGSHSVQSRGVATVRPVVVVSSFGPYPGNADIGMEYSSRGYTGVNIHPISYRGFELKSVGEALDAYSDNINGFEYRVDCAYDPETSKFTKTFVLVPINKPNPPAPGEVAPLSRYGADKLVFEYPGGNITEVTIDESAENAVTRFFASGETDLGPEAGPNIGIASAEELLRGEGGRKWPLLDASESIDGVEDENELHAHAQRYLSEAAPPYTTLTVSLNGSIAPFVGDYRPGDWCALILNDPFARMRLQSELEPRDDVIVRKIDSYKVNVPDGVTFPETVSLSLVAEWEVDKRG